MNRKNVSAEIERIVYERESTFRDCPSEMTVTIVLGALVRELQASVDEFMEAAMGEGATVEIAALRAEFAEAHAGGASSNDIAQLLDDFLVAHGQPTVLYAEG